MESIPNFKYFPIKDVLHTLKISEIIDSEIIGEKAEPHSSSISEIIDSKKCGYLNVEKALFQNSCRQSTC